VQIVTNNVSECSNKQGVSGDSESEK
jgi:hypothetical protein